jgi:uncharacterized protein (DUF2267 family)
VNWNEIWNNVGSDLHSTFSIAAAGAIITAMFQVFRDGLTRAEAKAAAIRNASAAD